MEKTFALVEDQSEKTERDEVEVILTKTETFSEDFRRSASEIKSSIAHQEAKIVACNAMIDTLNAELVEHYKVADTYGLAVEK